MRRTRRAAVALAGLALLSGCSALSGRDVKESPLTPAPSTSATTSTAAAAGSGPELLQARQVTKVVDAAKHDFETIYTFDYRHLAKFRSAGLEVTTTPYSTRYGAALDGDAASELRKQQQVQVPTADHVGIVALTDKGRAATVIVNGRLVTSTAEATAPVTKPTTVALHLELVGRSWKVSDVTAGGRASGLPPANRQLKAAVRAARSCVTKIFGLRLAHFDDDFAGGLGCTTADLHGHLQQSKATQQQTLADGKYDLNSQVKGVGVVRTTAASAELLVVVDEFRIGRTGTRSGPYPFVFDVIALHENGKWLMSVATQVS
jgi:hypothetical protein